MESLAVLFDERCPLCRWASGWLAGQEQLVRLEFVPAGSTLARERFPDLDHGRTLEVLMAVGSDGNVYRDEKAWLMCLWSLRRYRRAAQHFAKPRMLPLTSRFVRMVGKYRPTAREDCSKACSGGEHQENAL